MTELLTINGLLERAAESQTTGLRILDRREESSWLPWPEIFARARNVAGSLRDLGIDVGDRVAVVFPTCGEFFDMFFGTLLAGAVPVPMYPPARLGRLDEYTDRTATMIRAAGCRLVLAHKRVRRNIGPVIEKALPELGCHSPESLPVASPLQLQPDPADLALVQFSSGTTVDPKPVALSHRAVVAQTLALNAFWPEREGVEESGVSWLPLYHDMGLIGCIFPALERPGTVTLIPPDLFVARPAVWLRAISRYRATLSPAPNFAYGWCVEKIRDEELEGVDLSSWRIALNGAEPVAPEVLRSFQSRFARWGFRPDALTPVYGLSEASLAVTFSDLDQPFNSRRFDRETLAAEQRAVESPDGVEIVSVGNALPGFEIRIVDAGDHELDPGYLGRVLARGPSLMDGYLGRPGATAEVLRSGWLDTGDLGFILDDELYLTGRAKDVLILRGRNHSPVEVEHVVDAVDGVSAGCTVAVSYLPDGAPGEVLVLLVEANKGVQQSCYAEISRIVAETSRAGTGLDPDHVEMLPWGTLPRTSSGKLRRQEALRRWQTGRLGSRGNVTPAQPVAGKGPRDSVPNARRDRAGG